jgi:hypothetical protein
LLVAVPTPLKLKINLINREVKGRTSCLTGGWVNAQLVPSAVRRELQ